MKEAPKEAPKEQPSGGNKGGGTRQRRNLSAARRRYVNQMRKAIMGKPSQLFNPVQPAPVIGYGAVQSNMGNPIEEMGIQRPIDKARIEISKQMANQLFLFPDTYPLAYRRQIEAPHVFRASPVYGF